MPFAVDHEGWGYESHLPLLYELLSRETPSPHFVRDGLTFLQREFSRVLDGVCQQMKSNPECLCMPSAVFQYYLELEMWATFYGGFYDFPGQFPEYIGLEVAEPDEGNHGEEYQAPSVQLPSIKSIGQNSSSQPPIPRPIPEILIPQGSAANPMNLTATEPTSALAFTPRKGIPTGPAAMRNKLYQKPIARKDFLQKNHLQGAAAVQGKPHQIPILRKDFHPKDFPQGPAAMQNRLHQRPSTRKKFHPKDVPQGPAAMQSKFHQKAAPRKAFHPKDFPKAPAGPIRSTKHAHGVRKSSRSSPPSSPIAKKFSQSGAALKIINSGRNSNASSNNSRFSLTQNLRPRGPTALKNSVNNTSLSSLQTALPPKSVPKGPTVLGNAVLVRMTGSVRDEAIRAILHKKGASYVPSHGWDNDGLPKYSIPCFAINGLQAFLGVDGMDNSYPAIRNAFPSFKIMFQKVRIGLIIIWPEVKGNNSNAMLAASDELWKEFTRCWRFLKSWADQGRYVNDIVTFMKNYNDDDPRAIVDAFKLERPTVRA